MLLSGSISNVFGPHGVNPVIDGKRNEGEPEYGRDIKCHEKWTGEVVGVFELGGKDVFTSQIA